jgi:hypothetical protein
MPNGDRLLRPAIGPQLSRPLVLPGTGYWAPPYWLGFDFAVTWSPNLSKFASHAAAFFM